MHPVSICGRSLMRPCRTIRALLVLTGMLMPAGSAGCLRSTMLRPGDGPAAADSSPPGSVPGRPPEFSAAISPRQRGELAGPAVAAPVSGPAQVAPGSATTLPPAGPSGETPLLQIQSASDPFGPRPDTVIPPTSTPIGQPPAASPTPLLDAAIERVAAVTRQSDPDDVFTPASLPAEVESRKDDAGTSADLPKSSPLPPAPALASTSTTLASPARGPSPISSDDRPAATLVAPDAKAEPTPEAVATQPLANAVRPSETASPPSPKDADEQSHAATDISRPAPVSVEPEALEITKLSLCRKVLGFGSFEALAETSV